jgi:hypothetical protein
MRLILLPAFVVKERLHFEGDPLNLFSKSETSFLNLDLVDQLKEPFLDTGLSHCLFRTKAVNDQSN